jgi:hypothetical protein
MNLVMADSLKVYDILKDAQIPEHQARAITQAIRESDRNMGGSVGTALEAVSADVAELKADVTGLKADVTGLKVEMADVKADIAGLKADIAEIRSEMATKDFVRAAIADAKSELLRWMFIFWAGQMAATVGIVFGAIKYLK